MRREFRLGKVMVTMFHSHGKENAAKGRVNSCWRNLFDEGMKAVNMKDVENPGISYSVSIPDTRF